MLQLRNFDDVLQSCGCLIILMMSHNFEDILRYSKVFYKFVKCGNFKDVHLFPPPRSRPRENLTARCTEISYLAQLRGKNPHDTINCTGIQYNTLQ